uniref:Uncharacterized protein n=1 Tax=Rhizophora mucronata TaxID=61149 RepID=A0A2P2KCC6_RHIMU
MKKVILNFLQARIHWRVPGLFLRVAPHFLFSYLLVKV